MEAAAVQRGPGLDRMGHRLQSTLGQKYIMAVTGVALLGFVIMHLVGNLQLFRGPEALNKYAHFLQTLGGILWGFRAGLLVLVGLHIWLALKLTLRNRAARPVRYAHEATVKASLASRTMRITGVLLLVFIIYHLLHFTFGALCQNSVAPAATIDPLKLPDVYSMVVKGFQDGAISGSYILFMLVLGMHLHHGVASMFQSLGILNDQYRPFFTKVGPIVAWLIVLGNIAMPIAVLAGVVQLPAIP